MIEALSVLHSDERSIIEAASDGDDHAESSVAVRHSFSDDCSSHQHSMNSPNNTSPQNRQSRVKRALSDGGGNARIPEIRPGLTFDSDKSNDDGDHDGDGGGTDDGNQFPSAEIYLEVFGSNDVKANETCESWRDQQLGHLEHIAYISCFALFGTVVRMYSARFFGLDCEYKDSPSAVTDFLSPLTDLICITASGKTSATGGALFTDLPTNMLGCFIAGLVTPVAAAANGHNIAWFRQDHPLQQNKAFLAALRIGFCGSLTTFSSWNSQMVVMMDGSATALGSQVPAALFGYLIGIMCPIASFYFGRHVYEWLISIHSDCQYTERKHIMPCVTSVSEDVEMARTEPPVSAEPSISLKTTCLVYWEWLMSAIALKVTPFVVAALLIGAFAYAGHVQDIPFYRKLWLSAVLAPFGATFRWWLIKFNDQKTCGKALAFVPWGTLTANILACILSIGAEVIDINYFALDASTLETGHSFLPILLLAFDSGFSGSLSSVSTFVTELVAMKVAARAYAYGALTILSAMLISLTLYSPIVRS